jgi:hypothetical protein
VFQFDENSDTFKDLQSLYKVSMTVNLNNNNQLQILTHDSLIGPAWFPQKWILVRDWEELAKNLKSSKENIRDYLQSTGLFLSSDSNETYNTNDFQSCKDREIGFPPNEIRNNVLHFNISKGSSQNKCILVIATNYSKKLRATDEKNQSLDSLPVYGSLMGVVIKPDSEKIFLRGDASIPNFVYYMPLLGLILTVVLTVRSFITNEPN